MTTNGKDVPELALFLVSGKWLVAKVPRADIEALLDIAQRGVFLSPVFEYHGQIAQGPRGVKAEKVVVPVEGLISLTEMAVRPEAIVRLSDLNDREQKDIERSFEQCLELVGKMRLAMAGVTIEQPRIVLPPGMG